MFKQEKTPYLERDWVFRAINEETLLQKQVCFQGGKVLEVNRQNLDEEESSPTDAKEGTHSRIRTSTTSQKYEFLYCKVLT